MLAREHLGQELLQQHLAESAPDLRRLEDLLEPLDLLADVHDPLRGLAELAEASLHLGDNLGGTIEPIAHRGLRVLDELHPFVQLVRHFSAYPLQLGRHALLEAPNVSAHAEREVADLTSNRLLAIATLGADRFDLAAEQLGDRIRRGRGLPELAELPPRGCEQPQDERQENEHDRGEEQLNEHVELPSILSPASGGRRS